MEDNQRDITKKIMIIFLKVIREDSKKGRCPRRYNKQIMIIFLKFDLR